MKLMIFAGTSEGHALCRFLSERGAAAEVFVATEYGEQVQGAMRGVTVHRGRLSADEMAQSLTADALVIDATHPYAAAVSRNIRTACEMRGADYLRLLRPAQTAGDAVYVPDTAAAVAWLSAHEGRVLLTTGSKELAAYTAVQGWRERLYVRVLPSAEVLAACEAEGFAGAHLIAMQGPFSEQMNAALLRQTKASILVTKDSGASGGFAEKLAAAKQVGAAVLVIARPTAETGYSLAEMQALLQKRLGLAAPAETPPRFPLFVSLAGKRVLVVGAGNIAARRVRVLERCGAAVTVVAKQARAALAVTHVRGYEKSDLSGVFLAVAATDDRETNRCISADCKACGILCSVADSAAESTFFFPALCEGGGLVAGVVSDGGAHHAVRQAAARIRALLEERHEND